MDIKKDSGNLYNRKGILKTKLYILLYMLLCIVLKFIKGGYLLL